jgi:hypothetical protein
MPVIPGGAEREPGIHNHDWGRFRDTVRGYWRGVAPPAALAPRLLASGDLFNHEGRRIWGQQLHRRPCRGMARMKPC